MPGEGFVTREAFGIFTRNLNRRIGALEAQRGGAGGGGGAGSMVDRFIFLKDVPSSYSAFALRHVRVNTGETGLEFAEKITISNQAPSSGNNGDIWLQHDVSGGYSAHALLSTIHSDTLAASVVAGDLIYGNATPKWARLAKGTDGNFLKMVSGYPAWAVHGLSYSDVGAAASGHNHSGVYEPVIAGGTSAQYYRGDKSWQTLNQAAIAGLLATDHPTFDYADFGTKVAKTTTKCAALYLSATMSDLTDVTPTLVTLDTEGDDPGSNFNTGTHLFTCPVAGYYLVTGIVAYIGVIADKEYRAAVYLNGSNAGSSIFHSSSTNGVYVPISIILKCAVNDTIGLYAYVNCGANTVDVYGGVAARTHMEIHLLSLT